MKTPWKNLSLRNKERLAGSAYLWPSLLGVGIFFFLPMVVVCYYALIDNPINHHFVFLQNFIALFQNTAFKTAAVNTLTFSAIAVPLAILMALALAILLESRIPFKSQFRAFFLSPMMVPVASVVLIWQVIFHYNGALNDFLAIFGVAKIDWLKSEYDQMVVILLFLWKNLGYSMILFMAALANIPRDLLEMADIEGATRWFKFVHVKLRFLSPTLLFVTILSLINSFKVFREVYLLTGNYPYEGLYLLQHFMNNTFRSLDYQKLSAAAIIMAIVMVALIGLLFLIENRFGKDVEG